MGRGIHEQVATVDTPTGGLWDAVKTTPLGALLEEQGAQVFIHQLPLVIG